MFGILYTSSLIVEGDIVKTANNIMASESLFRLSILSALLVQVGHLFLVLLLYKILKPVNKNWAVLMVILMLIGIPITMFNELNRFAILIMLGGINNLSAFNIEQVHSIIPMLLDFHSHGIFIVEIFWGLWLFPMGYLVYKSTFLPKILGILLILAGIGYLIEFFTFIANPNFFEKINGITQIFLMGEIVFPIWLVIMGINTDKLGNLDPA
jgi:hypothetical protein